MYENLSTERAIKLLKEDDNANWSWSGAKALVEYLEDLENALNKSIEFDRIAFRCEYSEYSSALEAAADYGYTPTEDDEIEFAALTYLENKTTVIKFESGVIIQQF